MMIFERKQTIRNYVIFDLHKKFFWAEIDPLDEILFTIPTP